MRVNTQQKSHKNAENSCSSNRQPKKKTIVIVVSIIPAALTIVAAAAAAATTTVVVVVATVVVVVIVVGIVCNLRSQTTYVASMRRFRSVDTLAWAKAKAFDIEDAMDRETHGRYAKRNKDHQQKGVPLDKRQQARPAHGLAAPLCQVCQGADVRHAQYSVRHTDPRLEGRSHRFSFCFCCCCRPSCQESYEKKKRRMTRKRERERERERGKKERNEKCGISQSECECEREKRCH
jgi:heme/copper-type cytochrome/quinol oxidase subunit 4